MWGGHIHLLFALVVWPLTTHIPSLSRRSTVPTPNKRHLQHLGAHYAPSIYFIEIACLSYPRPVSPSADTIYLLGQRTFSRYSLVVYRTLPCHIHTSNFLISFSNASRSSLYISHSLTMWVILYIVVPHGRTRASTPSSSRLLVYSLSSFW